MTNILNLFILFSKTSGFKIVFPWIKCIYIFLPSTIFWITPENDNALIPVTLTGIAFVHHNIFVFLLSDWSKIKHM